MDPSTQEFFHQGIEWLELNLEAQDQLADEEIRSLLSAGKTVF